MDCPMPASNLMRMTKQTKTQLLEVIEETLENYEKFQDKHKPQLKNLAEELVKEKLKHSSTSNIDKTKILQAINREFDSANI